MPILVCLAMAGILYFLLDGIIGHKDKSNGNLEVNEQGTGKCSNCNKKINTSWRYCPFCGFVEDTQEER